MQKTGKYHKPVTSVTVFRVLIAKLSIIITFFIQLAVARFFPEIYDEIFVFRSILIHSHYYLSCIIQICQLNYL